VIKVLVAYAVDINLSGSEFSYISELTVINLQQR